jgi:hypothetical protein
MHLQLQTATIGIDQSVPLAALDLLAGVIPRGPPASAVLTLWASITAALGLASRPARSRSSITR